MPTEVHTMCFHTRDAVQQEGSSYTFRLPSDRLRTGAAKVALASCEFPMVQWTVETEWNRLYMNEGIVLTPEVNVLEVATTTSDASSQFARKTKLKLPSRLTRLVGTEWKGSWLHVQCAHPHHLWSERTGEPLRTALDGSFGGVRLLGGSGGDLSLTAAFRDGALEPLTPTSFRCRKGAALRADDARDALYLFVPTIPSPHHLCEMLTEAALQEAKEDGEGNVEDWDCFPRLTFAYVASEDRVRLTATNGLPGSMVRLMPASAVTRALGLSTMAVRLDARGTGEWACEGTGFWDYVEMPPGFYAPCHRPMCTGQPMRFGPELELAVNRLYFPLPAPSSSPHQIVFSDPDGRVFTCTIPCGRYASAEQLCQHLETGMTRAVQSLSPNVTYSVSHDEEDRFTFSCERRTATGYVQPARFSLLFHHPLSVDPERFGFSAQPLSGADTYTSPRGMRCARTSNVLRLSEIVSQKRFRLHATSPPPLVAVVVGGCSSSRLVHMRTHVNQVPFAHGYRPGDVVRIAVCGDVTVEGQGDAVPQTPAQLPSECSCVVAETNAKNGEEATILSLHVPRLDGLADVNTCFQVTSDPEPWNLCFCKERALPPHLLGFHRGAVLWGVHGSVRDADGRRLPPFEAPRTHCLDHPDYVLLTFSESAGASLEHTFDGENRHVFCKLSLYPLFREERMLPRDTTLLRSNLHTFTLSFWNPDLRTPYQFHGADFSFSLNFLSAVPDT